MTAMLPSSLSDEERPKRSPLVEPPVLPGICMFIMLFQFVYFSIYDLSLGALSSVYHLGIIKLEASFH